MLIVDYKSLCAALDITARKVGANYFLVKDGNYYQCTIQIYLAIKGKRS